ncbi:MAG: gamma-glutamyl-gamma-aminobutyrate hydrolase family protein [Anaerolineae bacterium]|nr:gamma-glutamyl-gamma-aminobutyrate hydrolase family protein [Anaerolineae bacterium]
MGPRIGITSRRSSDEWVARQVARYIEAINEAGGEAVVLAADQGGAPPSLEGLDGLLLSGGGDVTPSLYGQGLEGAEIDEMDRGRDEMERRLIGEALARDVPVLGICRGMQVLNVMMGGALVQDIPGHRAIRGVSAQHPVRVETESKLGEALGAADEMEVNSRHHQGVTPENLAPGLVPVASHEGLIEAVESRDHRWVVAVQWHPERYEIDAGHFSSTEAQRRLFRAFVRAADEQTEG